MRKRLMGMLGAGAIAVVVALIGGTTPAYAATWTVGPGAAGAFNFSGSAGATLLTDTTTGTQLTCTSSTAAGNSTRGTGLSGTNIARITSTTFSNCTGPAGITFTVTHSGTWTLNAVSYSGGVTTGTITGISARLSGPLCSATVTGSVQARFTNSNFATPPSAATLQILTTGSTLRISSVSGCFGLIRNGDAATFSGTYRINNPIPLRVTSP